MKDSKLLLQPNCFFNYVHLSCLDFIKDEDNLSYLPCQNGIFPISYIKNIQPNIFIDEFMRHFHNKKNFMDAWFHFCKTCKSEIYKKLFLSFFHFWSW